MIIKETLRKVKCHKDRRWYDEGTCDESKEEKKMENEGF